MLEQVTVHSACQESCNNEKLEKLIMVYVHRGDDAPNPSPLNQLYHKFQILTSTVKVISVKMRLLKNLLKDKQSCMPQGATLCTK